MRSFIVQLWLFWLLLSSVVSYARATAAAATQPPAPVLLVPESAPVGHVVGYVEGRPSLSSQPIYFIVFPDETTEKFLKVDDRSGEIATVAHLDYEKRNSFHIIAIPIKGAGQNREITVQIEDENDQAPVFPEDRIKLEISEFARIGAEYALPTAIDNDGPTFTVQKYRIAQGNVNNVFKISTRKLNDILSAYLVVNGQLDREYRDKYELIVEAIDGGKPAKIGTLRIEIEILDGNDNAPQFSQPRYTVDIRANLSVGTTILNLKATDADLAENGRVRFRFQKMPASSSSLFSLSPAGALSTAAHLEPGSVHDLIVTAYDAGQPSLEATAFATVTVQGASISSPALDMIWLTETSTAHLLENITLGSIVARISTSEEHSNSELSLAGCLSLCLQQSESKNVYLLLVCGMFDREANSEYHLRFIVKKDGEHHFEHPVLLTIGDINDNAPSWSESRVHISLNRSIGSAGKNLAATDLDTGMNGRIRYSIIGNDAIGVDPDTGRVYAVKELDCSVGNELRFKLRAEDNGKPGLSSDLEVIADLVDAKTKPPVFEKGLYEVEVKEDAEKGTCLIKVQASHAQCGGSNKIRYSLGDNNDIFNIDTTAGTICLGHGLDYETAKSYQLTVSAIDQTGLSSTTLVSISVTDLNDNSPIFYPLQYNITVREGHAPVESLLVVTASDLDSGDFGAIRYSMLTDSATFRIDAASGKLYAKRTLLRGRYNLIIDAKDGSGLSAEKPAQVHVSVIGRDLAAPLFTKSKYEIHTSEDILPGIVIGSVIATGKGTIKYSIYSGDPQHHFSINPDTGKITVMKALDADVKDTILLNIQADMDTGGSNHTQVVVYVEDHNDNVPEFALSQIEISVKEDQPIHEAFFIVHATDKDRKQNGEITYSIVSCSPESPIMVQPLTGQLQLVSSLDYETVKEYRCKIKATDHGIPPKSSNLTLMVKVLDVNDNAPKFEKDFYEVEVMENSPQMTEVLRLVATDSDAEENEKVHYRITNGSEFFTIDEQTGTLYVRKEIDRETMSHYNITVIAEDSGKPRLFSSTLIRVTILDVNDNAPSCQTPTLIVTIPDSASQLLVGTIVITDPDKGENGTVAYRSQQTHPIFLIKANGDVQLRRPLTDLDPTDYRLAIIASDQGSPRKSTVCHIAIKVMRGSTSNIKIITPLDNVIKIPSDCPINCRLRYINATGVHKWQLQSNEVSNHFSLRNGWLYLLSRPSQRPPYSLTLILADKQGRQKHIAVRVVTSTKSHQDPIVLNPAIPIGAKIGAVGEASKDGDFYYKNANESCRFELEESSGALYLAERLKASDEFVCFYKKINVTSGEEQEIEIVFETGPAQNEAPKFSKSIMHVTVREDTSVGTVIAFVNASVSDPTISITYKLRSPINVADKSAEYFSIDTFTGDVTLLKQLEWSEVQAFSLAVEAQCNGLITTMAMIIKVQDMNNHRPAILSSNIIYARPTTDGVVHRVVAVDKDNGQNARLKYEIVRQGKQTPFEIESETGIMRMKLIEEVGDEELEELTVRVIDYGQPAMFTEQILKVSKRNETSRWKWFKHQKMEVEVYEESELDKPIFILEEFKHYLLVGRQDLFELRDYAIYLNRRPPIKLIHLTILAFSPTNEADWMELIVKVHSESKPSISSSSCGSVTVPENQPINSVKRIIATGTSTQARFHLQGTPKLFKIAEHTGEISCSELDREMAQEHLLVVLLEDKSHIDSCTVKVTVADSNDNQPQFLPTTPQVLVLNDSLKEGDVIYRFSANDLDIGWNGRIMLDLIEEPSQLLDIVPDTGQLVLRRSVHSHTASREWMIRVRAADGGVPSLWSDRFVRIVDERKLDDIDKSEETKRLRFLRHGYISSVDEGLPKGQLVAKLQTNSRDSRITYSIVEGNADNAFSVDEEGTVRTALELDREIRDAYRLTVLGTGPFMPHLRTQVAVKVNNINDNPPTFSTSIKQKKIEEKTPAGSYITTLTANDIDGNRPLEFFIDKDEHRFAIDRYSGVLHSLVEFDYEMTKEIMLKVHVTDGNFTATTTLKILITDTNDNAPEFARPFYEITIPPSSSIGIVFAKIDAMDADSGDNGLIRYALLDSSKAFKIDPKDGSLSLSAPLDPTSSYLLTVTATDSGTPSLSRSVPVRIKIASSSPLDLPLFERKEFEFSVKEDASLYSLIGSIAASGKERPLFYRVLDSQAARSFEIDEFGRLFLKVPLDRESKNLHRFMVDVSSDASSAMHNSTAAVTIIVEDANDNSPVFTNQQISLNLKDGLTSGDVIQRLSATDEDIGLNGQVSYRILSGNDYGLFSLHSDTGAIVYNEWNDAQLRENPSGKWEMLIEASDHGVPRRSTLLTLPVHLNLIAWSGTAPFFVVPTYEVHVPETAESNQAIFKPRPVNRFGVESTNLEFALKDQDEIFSIDSRTGELVLRSSLDWETKDFYSMGLAVSDGNGRSAVVPLKVIVVPVDEYPPIFTQQTYTIQIPLTSSIGSTVGQVRAMDADGGVHGLIRYRLLSQHSLVSVDRLTGHIVLRQLVDERKNLTIEQISVAAESAGGKRSQAIVYMEIGGFPSHRLDMLDSSLLRIGCSIAALLFLLLVIIIYCFTCGSCCKARPLKQLNSPRKQIYTIARGQPISRPAEMSRVATTDSPRDELIVNSNGKASSMTSSVSTTSNLRASAMSNHISNRSQPDSGIDPDAVSMNSSVTDYLTSLGVNPHTLANKARNRRDATDPDSSLLNEYIYARVDEVLPPGPIVLNSNGVEPFSSHITVPPRRAPPTFQPLTEIFDEIAEMRNEDVQQRQRSFKRDYLQIEI